MYNSIKAIIAATALSLIAPSAIGGPVGNDLKDFWERTGGGVNYTRPSAYQGQQAGYATLGSLYVRTKPRNTSLAHIQLPSVRAGCGGIDIFGGSFSFISKEELIKLMEAIMQNAAGFAFELALESLSPTVQETVAKLRDLIQQVNSMNINSCEAGQAIVGSLWPVEDAASQHICNTIGTMSGFFADRASSRHGCGTGGEQTDTLNSATGPLADQVPVDVNYAWKAIKKNAFLSSNRNLAELFMTMTGTAITRAAANDNEGAQHQSINPEAFSPDMIETLVEGGTLKVQHCDEVNKCLNPIPTDITIAREESFFSLVSKVVRSMSDAISNDTEIPAEAIDLISITSVPVYETLITAKSYKYQFVDDEIALISELVAIDFAMRYINEAISEMQKSVSNTDAFGDILGDFQDSVAETQNNFAVYRRDAAERYTDAISTLEKLQLARTVLSASSSNKFATMISGSN
ncbi:hypothetical protein A9Q96_10035 [Rhodobacterales bacterium 52_120_T64]|nr:hypothetical protein A9Q96_10035 [Rhodobacterales bacterium 52_120_T64]